MGIKNTLYIENDIPADKFVLGRFTSKELKDLEILKKKLMKNFKYIVIKDFNELKSNI